MNEAEARQRLAGIDRKLDAAILAAKRELTEKERRLTDAVRDTQRQLDEIAVPAQFDVRAYASSAVAVLETYAEFHAAEQKLAQLHALADQLA